LRNEDLEEDEWQLNQPEAAFAAQFLNFKKTEHQRVGFQSF
jgi:hypothetical protein